jgi:hypothetical protein
MAFKSLTQPRRLLPEIRTEVHVVVRVAVLVIVLVHFQ